MGGGASRAVELAQTLRELAPGNEYMFAVTREIAKRMRPLPPQARLLFVPDALRPAPARMCWQHLFLPLAFARARVDWILSPFNVLPLGPRPGSPSREALIISNIGPFHPDISGRARGYQGMRNRVLRTLTYRSVARADRVFLLSREAFQLLEGELDAGRVTQLPMAPPPPFVIEDARRGGLPPEVATLPFFAVIGDLLPYKGLEDAILAAGELTHRGCHVQLAVVGAALDRAYAMTLRDLAQRNAPEAILFLGVKKREHVLSLMHSSVATLVCSRVENTSRVPSEAMAIGSPLIAADVPNSRSNCGDAALYYPPGDHAQLAELMFRLMEDQPARDDLKARGFGRIAELDWLSATRKILETLELS